MFLSIMFTVDKAWTTAGRGNSGSQKTPKILSEKLYRSEIRIFLSPHAKLSLVVPLPMWFYHVSMYGNPCCESQSQCQRRSNTNCTDNEQNLFHNPAAAHQSPIATMVVVNLFMKFFKFEPLTLNVWFVFQFWPENCKYKLTKVWFKLTGYFFMCSIKFPSFW